MAVDGVGEMEWDLNMNKKRNKKEREGE